MADMRAATTSGRMVLASVRSVRPSSVGRARRCAVRISAASGAVSPPPAPPIELTANALTHLKKLKADRNETTALLLRIGVRSGGCSGLSYHMDFEKQENITGEDMVVDYDQGNFKMVCDPKSLLYLFGMRLDYSDALIGGGFQFHNPNAQDTCGCDGKEVY